MNVTFFVNGRFFKTLCKTVLNADCFSVSLSTEKHTIVANISDKCYFTSIDNKNLDSVKTDFYFNRDFKNIKEFITKLEDVVSTFIVTSISDRHFCGNIDECIAKILDDIKESKRETETDIDMKDIETSERETAKAKAKAKANAKLNSAYGITAERETAESGTAHKFSDIEFESFKCRLKCLSPCDFPGDIVLTQITDEMNENQLQEYCKILLDKGVAYWHRGVKMDKLNTLLKSLIKSVGLEETKTINFKIIDGLIFFNYKGEKYKYYINQCKIFRLTGKKYVRTNWKKFADSNTTESDSDNLKSPRPPP